MEISGDKELRLRCYAYGSGRNWEAICVDLDIAVFGASAEEVETSLRTAIELHIETLADLPVPEQRRFLARQAPWHVRAKLAFMTWLNGLMRHHERRQSFVFYPQLSAHP